MLACDHVKGVKDYMVMDVGFLGNAAIGMFYWRRLGFGLCECEKCGVTMDQFEQWYYYQ